jgi:hypothetical protein
MIFRGFCSVLNVMSLNDQSGSKLVLSYSCQFGTRLVTHLQYQFVTRLVTHYVIPVRSIIFQTIGSHWQRSKATFGTTPIAFNNM